MFTLENHPVADSDQSLENGRDAGKGPKFWRDTLQLFSCIALLSSFAAYKLPDIPSFANRRKERKIAAITNVPSPLRKINVALPILQDKTEGSNHSATTEPNDPFYPTQWNLQELKLSQAKYGTNWQFMYEYIKRIAQSDPARLHPVIVAILDTGVNMHQDFPADFLFTNPLEIPNNGIDDDGNGYADDEHGCGFIQDVTDCTDLADTSLVQHGTSVSSIIIAETNNSFGVAGNVGVPIKLMPVKVVMPLGPANYSDIKDGLQYVIDMIHQGYPVRVVNMSIAGFGVGSASTQEKLRELLDLGVLVVAGSGNSASTYPNQVAWPAREPRVLAVGGTTQGGVRHPHSNYGPELDIMSPYADIPVACYTYEFCTQSGTSFSSPEAALLALALFSLEPSYTAAEVTQIITTTATPLPNCPVQECGKGNIDFQKAFFKNSSFIPIVWR